MTTASRLARLEARGGRRGFLLMEVAAAVALIGLVLVLTVRLVAFIGAERRADEHRRWATEEAQNILGRLALLDGADRTADRVAALGLDARIRRRLPGGRLDIRLDPTDGEPRGTRVRVEVRWRGRGGQEAAPVRLATWIYPPREAP